MRKRLGEISMSHTKLALAKLTEIRGVVVSVLGGFFSAASIQCLILGGINRAFGIFFVDYIRTYNTTSAMVSLIGAVMAGVFSVSCKYIDTFMLKTYAMIIDVHISA
jgi:hypothetical protein